MTEAAAQPTRSRWPRRRVLAWAGGSLVAVFLLLQLVPYGWRHPNPPVTGAAPWPDARAEPHAR